MKNNYQSYLYFIISVILTSFLWENINLPFNIEKKALIGSYSDTFQNPLNDIVRFIIFLFIPFLTLIIFYFKNGENFLSNLKEITYFNNSKVINHKSYELRFYFWFILVILIIEFFSLNFAKMNYEVDFFHEGMWLSASQNTKFSNDFWLSSYIVRGLFGDFYPFFLWKYFDIESIGITRFFNVLILFFNKVLLLLIALKLTLISNLRKDTQIIYFLSLSVTFLYLQGYGAPIFTPRSFLLLLFIYIFLNFLHFYHKSFLYVSLIGLFSSLSFFWFIDIGVYLNFFILILMIFFLIKLEIKKSVFLFFSIILGWFFFYSVLPQNEFLEFKNNTFSILTTLNYIHDSIFPTPFLSLDARSTKSLLLFLCSGLMIIELINFNKEKKYSVFLISVIFLFLISCIFFNYGLSRSDGPHIRIATGYIFITFFIIGLFYFYQKFELKLEKNNKKLKYINYFLVLLVMSTIFVNKKYENKNLKNLNKSISKINSLVHLEDNKYVNKEYNDLIKYYGKLVKKDKCVTIFTNEVALYYFLKKPSCSRFYYMWTSTPFFIQEQMVDEIYTKKPTFILYKSDSDIFYNSDKSLKIVNNFIKKNYSFSEKYSYWEIYKIKVKNK